LPADIKDLKAKGVEFIEEPTEEFYAVEAVFEDNGGTGSASPSQKLTSP
jgi:hypothetical protein